ncbi:MAG: hypothetical protein BJ554DRAFT_7937 [Olpidium bornovanus]|uniref:Uncharacterized protein n=1 Tax=Olpidium bornovanus TaxID=278681 RepID=A0A8H7ZV32_9FUNG|nr:MAG: hypothetical protein BJ554DRAFT_7937 [Olpidium bornovanus]
MSRVKNGPSVMLPLACLLGNKTHNYPQTSTNSNTFPQLESEHGRIHPTRKQRRLQSWGLFWPFFYDPRAFGDPRCE